MKTIYFGEITGDYLQSVIEGENDAFKTDDGKYYDFKLDITEDNVLISDTIGRNVPIGHEAALALLKCLKAFKYVFKHFSEHDDVVDFLLNEDAYYALPRDSE